VKRAERGESTATEVQTKKAAPKRVKKEDAPVASTPAAAAEKTTLGDIQSLSDLKDKMDSAAAEKVAKKEPKKEKAAEVAPEAPAAEAAE
jgi:small subunit ribosomal protein S1